ncbi:hypothetical protein MTR67_043341, partial [Solanum verrucosum]
FSSSASPFHISLLKKCVGDPAFVVPLQTVGVKDSLSYEDVPVEILDRQVRRLRNKEVSSVKISRICRWIPRLLSMDRRVTHGPCWWSVVRICKHPQKFRQKPF